MKAVMMILAGGAATLAAAAPASAQYYPGNPYGYGGGPGYGYGQVNSQAAANQCAAAVQQRLGGGGYGYNGYDRYNGGGYNGYNGGGYSYGGGRVLGISRIEPRPDGGLNVRGVATTGRYGGYGYNGQANIDLNWRCRTDYRGFVADVDVRPAQRNYGYDQNYTPWTNDYSQYGYQRY